MHPLEAVAKHCGRRSVRTTEGHGAPANHVGPDAPQGVYGVAREPLHREASTLDEEVLDPPAVVGDFVSSGGGVKPFLVAQADELDRLIACVGHHGQLDVVLWA